jgi:acid phosphatase (class A)
MPKVKSLPLRSYPCSRAAMGYTLAIVLGSLVPRKSQLLLARAADYACSREVCGDHYHSDVEAGHVLGLSLGVLLSNNVALEPEIEGRKS